MQLSLVIHSIVVIIGLFNLLFGAAVLSQFWHSFFRNSLKISGLWNLTHLTLVPFASCLDSDYFYSCSLSSWIFFFFLRDVRRGISCTVPMKQTKYFEPNDQYYSRETDERAGTKCSGGTTCFGDVQYAVLHILSKENPPQPLLISCATPNPEYHHSVTRPRRMCNYP